MNGQERQLDSTEEWDGEVDERNPKNSPTKWSNTVEFVVSLIGYSTGMSDFWRFPYLVWRNGGGAFLLAYGTTLATCGIPLFFLEVVISQYSGKGVFEIWGCCPLFKGIGISIALLNLFYVSYVSTMRYWLLEYMVQSFTTELPWTSCGNSWNTNSCVVTKDLLLPPGSFTNNSAMTVSNNSFIGIRKSAEEEFWQYNILSLSKGIDDVGVLRWNIVLYAIILKIVVIVFLVKSVKTIGKLMFLTTFLPTLVGLAMLIQSFTLDGASDGLIFLITPDFTKLKDSKVWIEALFMAFYSLGPGWGGIMAMGSHLKFKTNCLRNVLIGICGDVVIALFSSIVLFSILGVMANDLGVPVKDVVDAGMSIGLVGYSRALSFLPAPYVWAVLFFFAVMIVGLDAQVVCTETIASVFEGFQSKVSQKRHLIFVIIVSIVTFILNLPFCTQAGPYMFQLVDWYEPTWPVVVIALLEIIAFMWLYGGDRVDDGLKDMIGRKMPHVIRIAAAYLSPLLFLVLLISSFVTYKPPRYGLYVFPPYALIIGWTIAFSIIIPIPLYIGVRLARKSGTLKQEWQYLTRTRKDWGPRERKNHVKFLEILSKERSLLDIAFYNLTGRKKSTREKKIGEMQSLTCA